MAWQRKETHDLRGQHGRQDGFRRGKTKTHCGNYGGQNVQGWITAASLREMTEVQGQTTFEKYRKQVPFYKMYPSGER